ncbi:MAG: hypothetical protein AAGF77_14170 [Bacteroidota bacterium]
MAIKKLIYKVFLFTGIWFVVVYAICLLLPFHYFNAEYPMWKSKMEMLSQKGSHKNYIIGDSRAISGIDPKMLGSDYYNLALGGGTPMEGYYMLKRMLQNGLAIDTIIVSYAPIHLEQSEMFWDRQVKYGFYTPAEVKEIFNVINEDNEVFWHYEGAETFKSSEKEKYLRRAYLTYAKFPTELRTELSKSLLLRGYTNYKVYGDIKQRKGSFDFGKAQGSHDLNVEALRQNFRPKKVINKSLQLLFTLAKEHHIKVIFSSMPMNKSSFVALHQDYKEGVLEWEAALKNNHPEVEFLYDALGYYEDRLFGDGSHLNALGRQQFTLDLKRRLLPKLEGINTPITRLDFD